jgi:hypothetical protein
LEIPGSSALSIFSGFAFFMPPPPMTPTMSVSDNQIHLH